MPKPPPTRLNKVYYTFWALMFTFTTVYYTITDIFSLVWWWNLLVMLFFSGLAGMSLGIETKDKDAKRK